MRTTLITALAILLSAAPVAADGIPDELPPFPDGVGDEVCTGKLTTCQAGLTSCQQDRDAWQGLANECLGLPSDTSLDDARKHVATKPPKKKPKRTRKRRTPKKPPAPVKGEDGKDGVSVLWSVRELKPGKTCANGGYVYLIGSDTDGNGTLDPTESAQHTALCHGRDGKDGEDGKDGRDGLDGRDGKDGRDGDDGVRPEVGVGNFSTATFAKGRPHSYAAFATASLGWPLSDTVSLTLEGGAAPGRDAAMMLRGGLDWRLWGSAGLKTGLVYQVVGLDQNNRANDQFALMSVGVYKDFNLHKGDTVNLNLRAEASGLLGVDGFINADRKTRIAGGVGGGLGLRLEFN